MASGGLRRPAAPAPASGPGRLSRRTDGGPTQTPKYMPGLGYGRGKALAEQERQAPLAGQAQPTAGPVPSTPGQAAQQPTEKPIVPIAEPTQRPNEPLSAGMPFGPGPGPEALNLPQQPVGANEDISPAIIRALLLKHPGNQDLVRLVTALNEQGR